MAERRSSSKSNSGRVKPTNVGKTTNQDLISREEEYKRLNEELEARTASLVKEAESVIRGQESFSTKTSLLDNISTDDFLGDWDKEDEDDGSAHRLHDTPPILEPHSVSSSKPPSARSESSRPSSKISNKNRSQPVKKRNTSSSKPGARNKSKVASDDVALPDEAFMTEYKDYSLQKTISNIEGRLEAGDIDDEEDILPSAAAEMGAEAQMRFLKAKLRVMQEEVDRLSHDLQKKEEECNQLAGKIKETEDEKLRLQRTTASQQTQMDKYKRIAEDSKGKVESLESQLSGLRKELESVKRSQKQQVSTQSATEVRLNRALEDIEKYKAQLHKSKSDVKESSEAEKKRLENLMADNKRLEKQKNELMAGFKKQLKLIDILKKQKMHIEAAKMLSFTEEEFVKALEWGSN